MSHQSKIEFDRPEITVQPETSEPKNVTDPLPDCISKLNQAKDFYCDLCELSVNSQQQLTQHLESNSHKLALAGSPGKPKHDSNVRKAVSKLMISRLNMP